MSKKNKIINILLNLICVILVIAGFTAFFAARWYIKKYGDIGFASILYTLNAGLNGTSSNLINDYLLNSLCPALMVSAVVIVILLLSINRTFSVKIKTKSGDKKLKLYPFSDKVSTVISAILFLVLTTIACFSVGIPEWAGSIIRKSSIYENEYIAPENTEILFPDKKRNLIYIYLESMETSYLSEDLGGAEPYNLIPELYQLAEENTNFSHNSGVGGWGVTQNTTWTVASMIAQTSGVPLSVPVNGNTLGNYKTILPGLCTIQDILHDAGYLQALMVGSDASFAGRDDYYLQHGTDYVYDLNSARNDGIVPSDYRVWWGMEDKHLFEYAKQKLTEMSESGQPFAFTMLTVDTHHIGGYKCDLCGNEYTENYENVIACSSRQTAAFVDWIKEQNFYEDTAIIICGDHLSMDAGYFSRNIDSEYDRHVYNCIINSSAKAENIKNRIITPMDMFPTALAAIGCQIDGERLGLGTNLFSGLETLAEKYGFDNFNAELAKHSDYYNNNFIKIKATAEE